MFTTEVITLQPGKGDASTNPSMRADWTPFAQPPDPVTGIMAHTPDPRAYHNTGDGRTMLPRANRHYGSQGFSTRPGVLNIDPTDPVKGTGGFTVDVEQVTKQAASNAAMMSGGNPLMAWQLAANAIETPVLADQATPRVAPKGQTGYVVPAATPGGAQVMPTQMMPQQQTPAAAALGGGTPTAGTVQNPAVKPPGPAVQPQAVVQPMVAAPPAQSMPQVQTAQAPTPVPAAQAPAPWQQPVQPQYPPPTPPRMDYPYYPPQPQQPPQPPQQPDPVQMAMVQALQAITEKLASPPTLPPTHPTPASLNDINFEAEKQAMMEERKRLEAAQRAPQAAVEPTEEGVPVPEDAGLDFLTTPPSSPKIQVMFDLGRGGRHLKRYHHVAVTGIWLTLVYDSRYEGDQFIPPTAQEGDPPITIQFPQHGRTVNAAVPNGANQRIGCMDLINFVIIGESEDQQQTAPTLGNLGQLGAEIQQLTNDLGAIS